MKRKYMVLMINQICVIIVISLVAAGLVVKERNQKAICEYHIEFRPHLL